MRLSWQRWAYERRVALIDRGWSVVLLPLALAVLLGVSDPWARAEFWAFAGEPMLGLLGGVLAARLVAEDGALALLLMRRSLWRLWLERLGLVLAELALLDAVLTGLRWALPPEPQPYWVYLPWTGLVTAVFFAVTASLVAVFFRQPLAGEIWTLLWALPSLMLIFPASSALETGIGPFFPFPVWFIHRRLTAFPHLRPLLQASERVPQHLAALTVLAVLGVLLHLWALHRLRRSGV